MNHHDVREADDAGDRRRVAQEVVVQLLVERRIDGVRGRNQQERISVRRRVDHRLGRDIGAAAGAAFDDDRLAEPLGEPLGDQARRDVG
jgi:hypothetical protein